jgi:Tol biopolymer transport system component
MSRLSSSFSLLVPLLLISSGFISRPLAQDAKTVSIVGPRYVAFDHNNVVHLYDRLGQLKPPGEKDEHPHIPQHFERGFHAALSKDAEFVVYSAATKEHGRDIVIWERNTNKVLALPGANSAEDDDYPSVSADGNLVAFNTQDKGAARTAGIRLYDRKLAKLLDLPNLDFQTNTGIPCLSPDGRFFAFSARVATRAEGDRDIFLYDRTSKKLAQLPNLNSTAEDWSARISNGGRWLAFCSRRPGAGGADLYLYDREQRQFVDLPGLNTKADESDCDLSADGRFLVYLTNRQGIPANKGGYQRLELLLYDRQTGKQIETPKLFHQTAIHFWPALSRE